MEQVAYAQQVGYPVQFSVAYPDRPLNRPSTAFRIILVIPIVIVLSAVSGYIVFSVPSQAYGSRTYRRCPGACCSSPRC